MARRAKGEESRFSLQIRRSSNGTIGTLMVFRIIFRCRKTRVHAQRGRRKKERKIAKGKKGVKEGEKKGRARQAMIDTVANTVRRESIIIIALINPSGRSI